MQKVIGVVLLSLLLLVACSEEGKQQAAQDLSHQRERQKAEDVQKTLDSKMAKDRQTVDGDKTEDESEK